MTDTPALEVKKMKYSSRLKKRALFYICIVAPFMIQFSIFYFYVNIETFILAFQKYVMVTPGKPYKIVFAGLENFSVAFDWLISNSHYYLNTLKFYFFELVIGFTLALLFSYYLYKRLPGHSMFKYFLFLPHILSSLLLVILYSFIVEDAYVAVCKNWFGIEGEIYGLLHSSQAKSVRFTTIIAFVIWLSFGTKVLVYTGTMESIDPSMVESANLDGVNIIQEFWFITMPMIWTTFMTFFITMLAGIFTNQMSLFTFYGNGAPDDIANIGYKLYTSTLNANLTESSTKYLSYPALSAIGLIITAVLTPVTLGVRKIMIKFGPSAE